MSREIKHLVLHCTASPQTTTVASILNYWREELKWKNPGYHFLIEANGTVHNLQPIEKPSNGVAGHNANSIHISYIGGIGPTKIPIDNRTNRQILEQIRLIIELKEKFPKAEILGHRDFLGARKMCPSFSTKDWIKACGLKFK